MMPIGPGVYAAALLRACHSTWGRVMIPIRTATGRTQAAAVSALHAPAHLTIIANEAGTNVIVSD